MPIYEISSDSIIALKQVSFASQKILESDIQKSLRSHFHVVVPDTMVLAEEFGDWANSWRSIDLLCLDKQANLVVVELKRTHDGGHMELQAIRYAAMISTMTFDEAVSAHSKFLAKKGGDASLAENSILTFLGWDEPNGSEFGQDVKIVLISADFSKEITSSVLWLNERDLDIRCVRMRPYEFSGKTLVDIQQVLPLPESADYQIQIKKKAAEERKSREGGADWTRYDLFAGDVKFPNLYKRNLFLLVVAAVVGEGAQVVELQNVLPARKFLGLPGKLDGIEFRKQFAELKNASGSPYDAKRYYLEDSELFHSGEKTWSLSNQWAAKYLPLLDQLIAMYPQAQLRYCISSSQPAQSNNE